MPRRAKVVHRAVMPDPKFHNRTLAKFINKIMECGDTSIAEALVYRSLGIVEIQMKRPAIDVFEQAIRNATPVLEVKPRRVGGATYQVPVEIKGDRRTALAMRWLIGAARNRAVVFSRVATIPGTESRSARPVSLPCPAWP